MGVLLGNYACPLKRERARGQGRGPATFNRMYGATVVTAGLYDVILSVDSCVYILLSERRGLCF